jgi:hypothetical protein
MNKDLLKSMEQETLDLKCIKVVKDHFETTSNHEMQRQKWERMHTHLQYKRETFTRKFDKLIVENSWIRSKFQHKSHPCMLFNLAFYLRTHRIESKSQHLELTTLKKNNIVEDGGHLLIYHCATRCECYRMPLSKGKVVQQTNLWMIVLSLQV